MTLSSHKYPLWYPIFFRLKRLPINRISLGNFLRIYFQPNPLAFPPQQHPIVPYPRFCFYSKPPIIQSLRTNSQSRALTAANVFTSRLDDYWLTLRLKTSDVPAAHLLISNEIASPLLTIQQALDLYFKVMGVGRQKVFFTTAQRYAEMTLKC